MLVHPPTSRLLHYILTPHSPSSSRSVFPATLFTEPFPPSIDAYAIWSGATSSTEGYADVGVDVCEADVPALCTENFDYHDMRLHFVNGVLTSELLGKNIAVHLVGSEGGTDALYIGRVRDSRTFAQVS